MFHFELFVVVNLSRSGHLKICCMNRKNDANNLYVFVDVMTFANESTNESTMSPNILNKINITLHYKKVIKRVSF